jgi:S1-C subfamily serine protease
MKAAFLSLFAITIVAGCATTPEQRAADEQRREAQREQQRQREIADRERRHREEVDRERQKYAHLSSDELRVQIASLNQEIAGGYFGSGLGFLIAKGIYDGKVKERDAQVRELVRRGDARGGDSVGTLPSGDNKVKGTGSGFFITEDGYFVTCQHVIKNANRVTLKVRAAERNAVVIRSDEANDIALLKAEGSFRAIPYTSSKDVRLGQSVFTLGYPMPELQGIEPKLTRGDISSLTGLRDDPKLFQLSIPVQAGNSGGPIIDERGNVVGILTGHLNDIVAIRASGSIAQNVNYATKSSLLSALLESVPEVLPKLKAPSAAGDRKFQDIVADVQETVAMVIVY